MAGQPMKVVQLGKDANKRTAERLRAYAEKIETSDQIERVILVRSFELADDSGEMGLEVETMNIDRYHHKIGMLRDAEFNLLLRPQDVLDTDD